MLNDTQVKKAKPKDKTYLLRDESGLYLKVDTAGRKYRILRFRNGGRERQISLGVYPEVFFKDTRAERDEFQAARARGELISIRPDKSPATFQEAAAEWLKIRIRDKAAGYLKSIATLINLSEIAILMRSIKAYQFDLTCYAVSIYTAARPGEIRHAEWSDIDLPSGRWDIPAEKMKMKRRHIIGRLLRWLQIVTD